MNLTPSPGRRTIATSCLPLLLALVALVACEQKQDATRGERAAASAPSATASAAAAPSASAAAASAPSATHAHAAGPPPGRWPFTSQRLVKDEDWGLGAGLSCEEATLMRNEIYARHGYKFKTKKLADYFAKQAWYKPENDSVESMLSDVERKNIAGIQAYEKNVCALEK